MQQLITTFYDSFAKLDTDAMASCYHPDIVFEDPAFGELRGERAMQMWQMLCASQKNKDFRLTYSNLTANDHRGSVTWEPIYDFSKTGRRVHNIIRAEFEFKEGKIIKHRDHFSLHRWAHQAMGFKGWLLGGTGFFKRKLQATSNHMLDRFIAKQ